MPRMKKQIRKFPSKSNNSQTLV